PGGCGRCKVPAPPVCCELCSPDSFSSFALPPDDSSLTSKKKNRTRVSNKYDAGPSDMSLRDALHKFRKARTIALFDVPTLRSYGPGVVMPNDILERIVDAAHAQQLSTVNDIAEITHWNRAAELGPEILDIIRQ
ncbi:hypothetical protein FA95DRAFT_1461601, partial [Auriscalpium vulgare]